MPSIVVGPQGANYMFEGRAAIEPKYLTEYPKKYLPIASKIVREAVPNKALDALRKLDPDFFRFLKEHPDLFKLLDASLTREERARIADAFITSNPNIPRSTKQKIASLATDINFATPMQPYSNLSDSSRNVFDQLDNILGRDSYETMLENNLISYNTDQWIRGSFGMAGIAQLRRAGISNESIAQALNEVSNGSNPDITRQIMASLYRQEGANPVPVPEVMTGTQAIQKVADKVLQEPLGVDPYMVEHKPYQTALNETLTNVLPVDAGLSDQAPFTGLSAPLRIEPSGVQMPPPRTMPPQMQPLPPSPTSEKKNDFGDVTPVSSVPPAPPLTRPSSPVSVGVEPLDEPTPAPNPNISIIDGIAHINIKPPDRSRKIDTSIPDWEHDIIDKIDDIQEVIDNRWHLPGEQPERALTSRGHRAEDAMEDAVNYMILLATTMKDQSLTEDDRSKLQYYLNSVMKLYRELFDKVYGSPAVSYVPSEGSGEGLKLSKKGYSYRQYFDPKQFRQILDKLQTQTGKRLFHSVHQIESFPWNVANSSMARGLSLTNLHKGIKAEAEKEGKYSKFSEDLIKIRQYMKDHRRK